MCLVFFHKLIEKWCYPGLIQNLWSVLPEPRDCWYHSTSTNQLQWDTDRTPCPGHRAWVSSGKEPFPLFKPAGSWYLFMEVPSDSSSNVWSIWWPDPMGRDEDAEEGSLSVWSLILLPLFCLSFLYPLPNINLNTFSLHSCFLFFPCQTVYAWFPVNFPEYRELLGQREKLFWCTSLALNHKAPFCVIFWQM